MIDNLRSSKIKGKLTVFTDSSCLEQVEDTCLFLIDLMLDFFEGKDNFKMQRLSTHYIDSSQDFIQQQVDNELMNEQFLCQETFFHSNHDYVEGPKVDFGPTENQSSKYFFLELMFLVVVFCVMVVVIRRRKK